MNYYYYKREMCVKTEVQKNFSKQMSITFNEKVDRATRKSRKSKVPTNKKEDHA